MLRYLLPLLLFGLSTSAQTIDENKTDEFTGARIASTSWEWLNYGGKATLYQRVRIVNGQIALHVKYMVAGGKYGVVFSIRDDDPFMLKLENDTIIKLYPVKGEVSCRGCGAIGLSGSSAWGTHTVYDLNEEQLELLIENPIVKTRMYTRDGYYEMDVNKNRTNYVSNALKLLLGKR